MRIFRYLFEHKAALLVVVLMFVIQACCDLAIPNFTSKIVDVGIQQGGVEDAVPEYLGSDTYQMLTTQLSGDELRLFQESYTPFSEAQDSLDARMANAAPASLDGYVLNAHDAETRQLLDAALRQPLVLAFFGGAEQLSAGELAVDAAAQDNLLEQQAIAAIRAEYDALGVDAFSLQMAYLLRVGLMMLGMTALAFLVHCIMNFFACRTATKIGRDLRTRLYTQVVRYSDAEVNKFSAASLITRGTNDIQIIQNLCIMMQRMLVYTPIIAIGGVIMVAQTNASMSWIIALAVVCVLVVVGVLMAVTLPKFKIMQKLIDRVNLVSREILTGLPVVRAFNRQRYEETRFTGANFDLLKTQLFTGRAMSFMGPGMMLIMNATSVAIVWFGAHYVDLGTIQTGDLIAFITYSMVIVSSFLIIGVIAIVLPRGNVAAQRVDEVIATTTSIQDALEVYDEKAGVGQGVSITFQDVSFHYEADAEEDEVDVLRHVSFTAEAGKTCAIIGPIGCGKSTVVKLIERFHDVNEGAVLIDGVDVRELSQRRLHELVAYVPQQSFLFTGTIRSNIAYSDDEMDEERVQMALEIAQAADFVSEKEDGLESEISQGGTNVSGGQRQRLSIARALATQAKAYIFDDSFSALDYKTDATLRYELSTKLAGKTVIIVAQRIATIMHAQKIIVLDEGRVVGQGTHEELLAGCDVYRQIALSQLSEEELMKGGVAV